MHPKNDSYNYYRPDNCDQEVFEIDRLNTRLMNYSINVSFLDALVAHSIIQESVFKLLYN